MTPDQGTSIAHVESNLSAGRYCAGNVGFVLSLLGICGVVLVGPFGQIMNFIGVSLTFLSLPGIFLSAFGLDRPPRRLAAWGLVMGLVAAMYLPTFCLPLFNR
jgi:hypothetical protein